jgi:hypothetical protein
MSLFRTTSVAFASTIAVAAIATGPLPAANAGHSSDDNSCAKQQTQLDRATAKLDALSEKFAAHHTTKNKKAKKAQVQRVAHAQARLDACMADESS